MLLLLPNRKVFFPISKLATLEALHIFLTKMAHEQLIWTIVIVVKRHKLLFLAKCAIILLDKHNL